MELDADKMELALGSLGDGSVLDVCLVPLEDYNRSTGQNITLNPGEVLLHKDAGTYGHDSITLLGNTFRIVEELPDFLDNGFSSTDVVPFLYLVVPSVDIMDSLLRLSVQPTARSLFRQTAITALIPALPGKSSSRYTGPFGRKPATGQTWISP